MWVLALVLGLGVTCGPAWGETAGDYRDGEILVKLRPKGRGGIGLASPAEAARLLDGASHRGTLTEDGWQVLGLPDGLSVEAALEQVRERAEVEFAEPNLRYRWPSPLPQAAGGGAAGPGPAPGEGGADDVLLPRLYGLERIGAPLAWRHTKGTNSVVIAVFDTGVDYTHPDLAPNMWRNPDEIPENRRDDDGNGFVDDVHGVNVVTGSGDPMDRHGHGTHVAGTIGAVGNNGLGVVGVNWSVQILAVRVARDHDGAFTGDLVRGLDYLTNLRRRGVNLVAVNHSWRGVWPSHALSEAFARLSAAGVLNVLAAGNEREDHALNPKFPNEYNLPGMLTVAASDGADHLAGFTDFGIRTVDVAAPGVRVWSTLPQARYGAWSGTSMATPHVTGAAGLLFAVRPDLTAEQARQLLMATVDPLPAFDRDRVRSGGRIHVGRAVEWLVRRDPLPGPHERTDLPPLRLSVISQSPEGFQADGASDGPGLSDDGRFVVFVSQATNLVAGDGSRVADVLLRDRAAGTTLRVSQTAAGTAASAASGSPVISGDGRVVVFTTSAGNLAPDDVGSGSRVILWERETGTFELVSRPDPGQAPAPCRSPSISRDGRRVAFSSSGALVAGDTNGWEDIYLRDRAGGGLRLVSVSREGGAASGTASAPVLSADGSRVAFVSTAADLVEGDGNGGVADVFVRDLDAGVTELISLGAAGEPGDGASSDPRLSHDGRFVAFRSNAGNLDPAAQGARNQIYVRDRVERSTRLVTRTPAGQALNGQFFLEAISADGRWVLFRSSSLLLPPYPAKSAIRLFAYDRLADDIVALAYSDAGEPALRPPDFRNVSGALVDGGAVSADGRHVAFSSVAWNLVPGDGNVLPDVFLLDRGAVSLDLVVRGAGPDEDPDADVGRGLVGTAIDQSLNLSREAPGETAFEIRVVNRGAAPVEPRIRVGAVSAGVRLGWPEGTRVEGEGVWRLPVLAPGGSQVLAATLPVSPGEAMARLPVEAVTTGAVGRLEVLDRVTAMVTLPLAAPGFEWVSRTLDGGPLGRHAIGPTVSGDGSRVSFSTLSDQVVARDGNDHMDVFLWDRVARSARVVSSRSLVPSATDWSEGARISEDGRWVLFHSWANNLGPDANYTCDVFLRQLDTPTVELINRRGSVYGDFDSSAGGISRDGRFVVVESHATSLVLGDSNRESDIFLFDREARTTSLVSRSPGGQPGNGDSDTPVMSSDGRFVAFASNADDLAPVPDDNQMADCFLWDREAGSAALLSVGAAGTASGQSVPLSISADGRYLVILSDAPDLPGALTDLRFHVYLLDRATGRFRPVEEWLPADGPSWEPTGARISSDGEWLTLTMSRVEGDGDHARLRTRVDLVHRTNGDRRVVATGERGPGASGDGFSEVSAQNPLVGGRYLAFEGDGREGRPFTRQAYLYDRARPAVDALAGRLPGALRPLDAEAPQEILRELSLLVTPGQPQEFRLALRNSGDVPDRLALGLSRLDPGWDLQVRAAGSADAAPLALPATFPEVPVGADVLLTGRLLLETHRPPGPVEFVLWSVSNVRVAERIRLAPLLDTDGDGLADNWETSHFGDLRTADGGTDFDGDGVPDAEEFVAGTDPRTVAPPWRVSRVEVADGGRVRLAWPAVSDRLYTVEFTGSAGAPFLPLTEPVPGDPAGLEWVDEAAPRRPAGLYRVRADLP